MAESLASLFASGTETYVLQRMSELDKKMDVVNADYLQLSWRLAESYDENAKLSARIADALDENAKLSTRIAELERKINEVDAEYLLAETLDENAKLSTRIADLEAKIDVVDTEYVQLNNDRWVSVKDTKMLELTPTGGSETVTVRQNMLCKLINLEKLTIYGTMGPRYMDDMSNKNVKHIHIKNAMLPNFENFPSCCMLTFDKWAPPLNILISQLSAQKNNIKTISFSNNSRPSNCIPLANYCKTAGISIVEYGS